MKKQKTTLLLLCIFLYAVGQAQISKTINVSAPGSLSTLLTADELSTVTNLTLTGNIDGRDFLILKNKMPSLVWLDLTNISIKECSNTEYYGSYSIVTYYAENTLQPLNSNISTIKLPKSLVEIYGSSFSDSKISSISIPKTVKRIGNYAFKNCNNLKKVIFEDSPTAISVGAFAGCSLLDEIDFGDSIQSVSMYAFNNCQSLKEIVLPSSITRIDDNVFQNCISLNKVIILAPITQVSSNMFNGCINLTEIIMPNTITRINESAFNNCKALRSIILSNSLSFISDYAFYNCTGLKTINLPNSLSYLGCGAFGNCTALDTVFNNSYVPQGIAGCNFFYGTSQQQIVLVVPYMTKDVYRKSDYWKQFGTIREFAEGVYLNKKKRYISDRAGDTIQINISAIGKWTTLCGQKWLSFDKTEGDNSDRLTIKVEKNDSLSSREANMQIFDSSNRVQTLRIIQHGKLIVVSSIAGNLTVSSHAQLIDNLKITGTMNARDFKYIKQNLSNLSSLDLSDARISEYTGINGTNENNYSSTTTYNKDELPVYAISSKVISLKIPTILKSFAANSLSGAINIQNMYVNFRKPSKINLSSANVFSDMDTLNCTLHVPYQTQINFLQANQWQKFKCIHESPYSLYLNQDTLIFNPQMGNSVTLKVLTNVDWGVRSSQEWLSVKKIHTPNVDSIQISALPNNDFQPRSATVCLFSDLLDSVYYTVLQDGKVVSYTITAGNLKTIIHSTVKKNVTNLVLTGTMDARDFRIVRDSMPNLISVDLSKVKILYYKGLEGTIRDYFYPDYIPVTFPANEIPIYAFKRDYNLESSKILNSVILPDTTVSIGEYAFSGCIGLTDLKINKLTTTIKNSAFFSCERLETFEIPESVKNIGGSLFDNCTSLKSVTINAPITTIPGSMFFSCKNLSTLNLPKTITSVGSYAFYECRALKEISLPQLISIGEAGFIYCSGLTEFRIPSTVTSIGAWSFAGCVNLKKIYADGINPSSITLGYSVFSNIPTSTCTLNVPNGSKRLYAAADQWKSFMNISEIITHTELKNFTGIRVITGRGELTIFNAEPGTPARIFNFSGSKITEQLIRDNQTIISLPTGFYLLRIGNYSSKIFVR